MFINKYEDVMNNSKDEETIKDGWTKYMRLINFIEINIMHIKTFDCFIDVASIYVWNYCTKNILAILLFKVHHKDFYHFQCFWGFATIFFNDFEDFQTEKEF